MIEIRKSEERGQAEHGWLSSRHTFSFADYYDPDHMGFRSLRVINDDRVQPGMGFGEHPHRDMEIVSYILQGALEHKDSMGNGSVIRSGEAQKMSAGTGIMHSEFNPSQSELVHFLQIWILPDTMALAPSYEQKAYADEEKLGQLRLIASRDGRAGSLSLSQDLNLYATIPAAGDPVLYRPPPGRHTWVHVATGAVHCNEIALQAGDSLAVSDEPQLALSGEDSAEVLLFDLA